MLVSWVVCIVLKSVVFIKLVGMDEMKFLLCNCSIYLLLNLFIIVGLFVGFYVIIVVVNGDFVNVVIVVFVVVVMDGLDGWVVCLIGISSEFGV